MSELKQIQITGGAAEDFSSVMKTGKRKRSSRKARKEGEQPPTVSKQAGGTSPGTLVALQASHVPTDPSAPQPKAVETTGLKDWPSGPAPVTTGGKAKVILEPKKKEPTKQLPKVKLEAPKKHAHASSHTRKARKIRVSLTNLNKRITRHKKIQKEAKVVPIDQVKKILVDAKLIKADSKAPESMLRQIYADYQALKNKAL